MAEQKTLELIEIEWSGPHDCEALAALTGPSDRGLIQVYGSHPVFGADSLLYIVAAKTESFAEICTRIRPWVDLLPSPPAFYVGRLGGNQPVSGDTWEEEIEAAGRLLEFFHSPPWNSRHVNHHGVESKTVVLNLGRRHRLMIEVSTMWDESSWQPGKDRWHPHTSTEDEQSSEESS